MGDGVFYVARAATVPMQRHGKHGSTTIEGLFSAWSVPRSYLEGNWHYSSVVNQQETEAEESPLLKIFTSENIAEEQPLVRAFTK
jgi:hypothetical protein